MKHNSLRFIVSMLMMIGFSAASLFAAPADFGGRGPGEPGRPEDCGKKKEMPKMKSLKGLVSLSEDGKVILTSGKKTVELTVMDFGKKPDMKDADADKKDAAASENSEEKDKLPPDMKDGRPGPGPEGRGPEGRGPGDKGPKPVSLEELKVLNGQQVVLKGHFNNKEKTEFTVMIIEKKK
ncbi:MAG: hypothetical protein K5839_05570 [Treponemataceae bacterium]|nr:hypothetical protein [Treponemataceae bacterium]